MVVHLKVTMHEIILVTWKYIEDITRWREDMNLCLSGKNYMSRVSAANKWDIVLATRT